MIAIRMTLARFLVVLVVFAAPALASDFNQSAQNGFRYGPNLSWRLMGNTPFVWGQWLPQAEGSLRYTWLEPLDSLNYGDALGVTPTYLKMAASLEVSPF